MRQTIKLMTAPKAIQTLRGIEITLTLPREYAKEAEYIADLKPDTFYTMDVKKVQKTKTLSQNAYAWELMNLIGQHLRMWSSDVYKAMVRDFYTNVTVKIPKESVEDYVRSWTSNGKGWMCEIICEDGDDIEIMSHYGMSVWTRQQMSDFIELFRQECTELHIPIERLDDEFTRQ